MVGQRFVSLLADHPWFTVVTVAASERSAKAYAEAVGGRWAMTTPIPSAIGSLVVKDASKIDEVAGASASSSARSTCPRTKTRALEESYARTETPALSVNSANRMTPDVPMLLPEVNPHHLGIIEAQRRRCTGRAFVTVKSNCSIQSYVPALHPLRELASNRRLSARTRRFPGRARHSRSGRRETCRNVMSLIPGEEEKSEIELAEGVGTVGVDGITNTDSPAISSQCIRVPVNRRAHGRRLRVIREEAAAREDPRAAGAASSRSRRSSDCRARLGRSWGISKKRTCRKTRLDRDGGDWEDNQRAAGMGITIGRLRDDRMLDYRFVCLSHNTIRGAAGGAVLTAELLKAEGDPAAK